MSLCPSPKEIGARTQPICDVLDHTEESYICEIFGIDTYELLLEDLIDYSDTEQWSDEASYEMDDVVCYQGEYYVLIVDENSNNSAPSCNEEWKLAPKFETECYENTYQKFKKLLAWRIYAQAAPFYPEVLSAGGFIGDDKDYKEKLNFHLTYVYKNIAMMLKSFLKWNDEKGCLTILSCGTKVETNQTSRTIMGY